MVVLIISMGIIIGNIFANVSHNGWWKCKHMTSSHVCTLYISCNIVVLIMAHLQ
jgi:hypothetical protein